MCLKIEDVENLIDTKLHNFKVSMEDFIILEDKKNYSKTSALMHTSSPETDKRLTKIEEYIEEISKERAEHKRTNKAITWWLVGSVGTFIAMVFSIAWWGATITASIDNNGEKIEELKSSTLIKQDASVFSTQLEALTQRVDRIDH